MGLLFPLYLLGALAVAIPIALHLRRRPTKDRIEFSSTMFLDAQQPPRRRSSRIEQWLLLALRCLALLLLALLFSRPLLRGSFDPGAGAGTVRLILIDRSASMRQEGAWEEALRRVREEVAAAGPGDRVALAAFGAGTEVLAEFRVGAELAGHVEGALAGLEPTWSGTALDEALISAVGWVEEEAGGGKSGQEIVLVSDFQEGASRDRLQSFAWPASIRLRLIPVLAEPKPNASLHVVAALDESDSPDRDERAESLRLRVTRSVSASGTDVPITVQWAGHPETAVSVPLPNGATRVLAAPPRPRPDATELVLAGDGEPFDNRAFVAPRQPRPVRVLFIGESIDSGDLNSPLFFLSRSLADTDTLLPEVISRRPGELSGSDWAAADVVLASATLGEADTEALQRFVQDGGLAVVLLPSAAAGRWLEASAFRVTEAPVRDYALLETIDFGHPVFRPFSAPGMRDFGKIRFWRHRKLEVPEDARVLARFDSGDPALVEWAAGDGRHFIWAVDWIQRDSQLPVSSKFVPLVYALLGEAGFAHREADRGFVGENLPGVGPDTVVTLPDGTEHTGPLLVRLPGVHRLRDGERTRTIACNLPYPESRLDPVTAGTFVELGIPLADALAPGVAAAETGVRSVLEQSRESEARQKLWKWFLLAAVVVLFAETWVAGFAPFRPRAPEPAGA